MAFRFTVSFSTEASGPVTLGGTVSDTATLIETNNATGTITFDLFGPNDATCARPPVFTSTIPVAGDGFDYASAPFTPAAPGTYRWRASYSGDPNNESAASHCGGPGETVVVKPLLKGSLTICKAKRNGDKSDSTFTVEGQTFTVAPGQCTPAIRLLSGEHTVVQSPVAGFTLAKCPTNPANRLIACNRKAGSAVVRVATGGVAKQTILTFVNKPA